MTSIAVSDLEYGCLGLPLQLRVLRKWTPHFKRRETWFIGVDKHGNGIALLGENEDQAFVESTFHLRGCYTIADYTCLETTMPQRVLWNPIHLSVGAASTITKINDTDCLPKEWFDFGTVEEFRSLIDKPQFLPDFIGYFKKFRESRTRNGQPMMYITVTNANGDETVITLWKDCIQDSQKFDRLLLNSCTPQTTVAFTNVRPSIYSERLQLASTDATHLLFNPAIAINALSSERNLPLLSSPYMFVTLLDLQSKRYIDIFKKKIEVKAWITSFDVGHCWYTALCSTTGCRKRIGKKGTTWFCTTHKDVDLPTFYFSFSALISDGTSVLSVIFTDNFVQKMIGTTCEKLIVADGYDDRKAIPSPIQQHVLRPYHMILELTKHSTDDSLSYAAITISKDSTIQSNESTLQNVTPDPTIHQIELSPGTSLSDTPPPHGSATKDIVSGDISPIATRPRSQSSSAKHLDFDSPPSQGPQAARTQSKRNIQKSQDSQDDQVPAKRGNPNK